eukprot:4216272-Pyramimonas_sp.AAC.1
MQKAALLVMIAHVHRPSKLLRAAGGARPMMTTASVASAMSLILSWTTRSLYGLGPMASPRPLVRPSPQSSLCAGRP